MSNRKIILLTGASSGIGEATARRLVQAGHHLVIGARRIERLQALRDELGNIDCLAIDVTQAEDLAKMAQFALQQHGRIDVLINNAGVMPLSPLAALKMEEWRQTIDVNVHGVLNGIAAVLPTMQQQRAGQIINVASIGAHAVFPLSAVYCASKFAVRAISDGLRQESDYIRVTVVSPGVVASELADHITDASAKASMEGFRRIALPAEAIADAIAWSIEQPDSVDVSEIIVRHTQSPY
ncbi:MULTISPECIES: SDR family oxidoreductase [Kosakonia]|mgnify:CR=1 FL=1|jgi:NADP-dependent 3-hydroxy acid dehydrogenase YdfG|uniref:SDR family oxidoreductase n=1 Tax=Kosakonia TaxID=1330547 RepID=UPI000349A618|nr:MULTISPECIES: SDR family oxidoreductase [Kosakonia]MDP9768217.1 NADP-dependent 3-hydroxy acid dehydrogenase YdfG [Atlantibacter hermannii]AST69242.1 NAD(P)-dependent oxidoreductase [Kosakonia cowanii]MBK0079083.1 SDR family oxidoreductase [Kosakonia sp. S57]MBK0086071.1 SDR family oxidoreductase [Kosakonia sp. S58]MDM9614796.1 SDR family oxidoreductase [Kosakonia cowanii]